MCKPSTAFLKQTQYFWSATVIAVSRTAEDQIPQGYAWCAFGAFSPDISCI